MLGHKLSYHVLTKNCCRCWVLWSESMECPEGNVGSSCCLPLPTLSSRRPMSCLEEEEQEEEEEE